MSFLSSFRKNFQLEFTMSFYIWSLPYGEVDGSPIGFGSTAFNVGDRFDIQITVATPSKGFAGAVQPAYEGEGELVIEDSHFTPPAGETAKQAFVKDLHGLHANMSQMACFGVNDAVPATPDNLVKAIQWCQANQHFMEDERGI